MTDPKPMYTLQEAAKLLHVSEDKMWRIRHEYGGVKVGRTWRFPARIVDAVVAGREEKADE